MEREVKEMQTDLYNDDMNKSEDDLFKNDMDYRLRDDIDEKDTEKETQITQPIMDKSRHRIQVAVLKEFYSKGENTKSEKVSEPPENKKSFEKNL